MTTFTVWKFEDPDGAKQAAKRLKEAQRDGLVRIVDHAIVSWPVGEDKPKSKHKHDSAKRGAGWGAFWECSLAHSSWCRWSAAWWA